MQLLIIFSSQQKYFTRIEKKLEVVSVILVVFVSTQNIPRDHFTQL